MKIELPYGRGKRSLTLPQEPSPLLLRSSFPAALEDVDAAVRRALAAPIGDVQALAEAARGAQDLVIVISDVTRPVPYRLLLPPLLRALEQDAGVSRDRIRFLVATGLHRGNDAAELEAMVGERIAREYRIDNHDARDRDGHVDLGTTVGGTRVLIDRRYLEADFRIATALIEPHLMAGFSGGRKALCPGLAAAETIGALHGAALLSRPGVETGRLQGNPLHAELCAAARLAGCEFSVNVTMDAERRLTGVYAGGLEDSHLAGCAAARRAVAAGVDSAVDVVVVTSAGHPLDATFYQAIKGAVAAGPVVREGGTVVLVAECAEGLGSEEFAAQVAAFESAPAYMAGLSAAAGFAIDQWQLQMLCALLAKCRVVLVSDKLERIQLGRLGIELFASPEEALRATLARHGAGARVAAMPEGPYLLAFVH